MLGSTAVEVLIGALTFLLLMSTASSAIVECVFARLRTRATMLKGAIDELMNKLYPGADDDARKLSAVEAIAVNPPKTHKPSDQKPGSKPPSYIPSCVFAASILGRVDMETSSEGKQPARSAPDLIQSFWKAADGKWDAFKQEIECWYNAAMDRLSGEFKRRVHRYLFWTGLTLAVAINADLIMVVRVLATNPEVRARMQDLVSQPPATGASPTQLQSGVGEIVSGLDQMAKTLGDLVSRAEVPPATGPERDVSPPAQARINMLETRLKSVGESSRTLKVKAQQVSTQARAIDISAESPPTGSKTLSSPDLSDRAHEQDAERALTSLLNSGLPLGWSGDARQLNAHPFARWSPSTRDESKVRVASLIPGAGIAGACLSKALGLLATAGLVSFGAPFWFDMLSKITNLRGTGPKPQR